jgi:hypothetical protein
MFTVLLCDRSLPAYRFWRFYNNTLSFVECIASILLCACLTHFLAILVDDLCCSSLLLIIIIYSGIWLMLIITFLSPCINLLCLNPYYAQLFLIVSREMVSHPAFLRDYLEIHENDLNCVYYMHDFEHCSLI